MRIGNFITITSLEDAAIKHSSLVITSKIGSNRCRPLLDLLTKNEVSYLDIDFDGDVDIVKKKLKDSNQKVDVFIDISLMRRSVIARLLASISSSLNQSVNRLTILYSLGAYIPPNKSNKRLPPNERVKPIHPHFAGWCSLPGQPVLTLVGLGYERNKAIGAIEYVESSRTIAFIPKSTEFAYESDVLETNKNLIDSLNGNELHEYFVEQPLELIKRLSALVKSYKDNYKIVILPFGPRLFLACALTVSMLEPNASVWDVSGDNTANADRSQQGSVSYTGFSMAVS